MITRDLIQKFRERANRNYYVLNKYRDCNGKNLWSCICSSMDWISVATSYLTEHPTPERNGNDDLSSVNVYTFISCVDMLFEAVKEARPQAVPQYGRAGEGRREKDEIGISALRMGNVVGIHEVYICTNNQTLTLRHEAHDRAMFADGAVEAAGFLVGKPVGLYNMTGILEA